MQLSPIQDDLPKKPKNKFWAMTINNPTKDDKDKLDAWMKTCIWGVYSYEAGVKTHTPHFQIAACKPTGVARILAANPRCGYCKNMKAFDTDQHWEYGANMGKWKSKPGELLGGPWHYGVYTREQFFFEVQGQRNDIADCKADIDTGMWLMELGLHHSEHAIKQTKSYRFSKMYEMAPERRNVSVYYFWGPPGIGKDDWVDEFYGAQNVFRCVLSTGRNIWWACYDKQKVVVLTDIAQELTENLFNNICDGRKVPYDVKGEHIFAYWDTVIILANKCAKENLRTPAQRDRITREICLVDDKASGEIRSKKQTVGSRGKRSYYMTTASTDVIAGYTEVNTREEEEHPERFKRQITEDEWQRDRLAPLDNLLMRNREAKRERGDSRPL